jgi:HTH-like domain
MVTPAVKREAVVHLKGAHEMSERRACRVIDCDRMTVRYRSRRPDDPHLRERLVALAKERRRFGYRRLLIFLRREGFVVNHKRLVRIYREERLMVRKRGGRKRALGTRTPMPGAAQPNAAGRSTSSPISSSAGGASAYSASMTTAPGNAWQRWPMSRCPAVGSRVNSTF